MSKNMKPHLSKGILQMKFMQRTKEKIDLKNEESQGRAMYVNEISDKMLNTKSNFIVEPSFVYCEGLSEGRFSFRGMNPEIERLLELEQAERDASKTHVQPTEVDDKDMANFYSVNRAPAATVTMARKFQHKKDQIKRLSTNTASTNKRKKFYNPESKESVDCKA